jgi:hypothetical protein
MISALIFQSGLSNTCSIVARLIIYLPIVQLGGKLLSIGFMVLKFIFAALTLYALMLVNGYKSGIQQILKPIELKSA